MNIVITDGFFPNFEPERSVLAPAGLTLIENQARTEDDVITCAAEADVLLVQFAPVSRRVVDSLQKCRGIVRYGIGFDNIDVAAAAERGIPVCNVPDYSVHEVADHTLALALALGRQLPGIHARMEAGHWDKSPPRPMPPFREMTFAVAGMGRIGRSVLERARSFGFRLGAFDPFAPDAAFANSGADRLERRELFEQADILSLHVPLSPETRHLLGRESIAWCKSSLIVVNTSRGGLIDTLALAEALREGRIAGAGLDVFEEEPLPANHPLRSAPNTILTPHFAWHSTASLLLLQKLAAEEALRLAEGREPKNQIN